MARVNVPYDEQEERFQTSPDYVRLSMAAAIELGLKPGRFLRGCRCGCINLLQNYPEGCYANCTYCGLARERPGVPEDNTFIRVAWPLFPTDLVAEKIAEKEASDPKGVGRVCIAQVQDPRAFDDLVTMTERVHRAAPDVPLSALVSATTLDEAKLAAIRDAGADIIGVGLDAASAELFSRTRGREAKSPHDWEHHWAIIRTARRLFGPRKVNCHVIVGLGETDRELVSLFYQLKSEAIAAYLFSFNPEPGTAMQETERAPIHRLRRVQLAKHLIEERHLPLEAICFDEDGFITEIAGEPGEVEAAIASGVPFMTDGCPDRDGAVACNRPYGSYRPGEAFRDYPFTPGPADVDVIRREMELVQIEVRP